MLAAPSMIATIAAITAFETAPIPIRAPVSAFSMLETADLFSMSFFSYKPPIMKWPVLLFFPPVRAHASTVAACLI
jgi:hypothetical protein